jgi:23S rRNA (uracil1939-C5)-methyltransferase
MMMVRKGQTLELMIQKMAYGGEGIGRVDGFVVFVRGAVPGDTVLARIYKKKKGFAMAILVEVVDPSPDRVAAPCPYSGHCGGCQWQHVAYKRQMDFKRGHVQESLAHIGGLRDIPVREPIPSPRQFAYRNKMEFSFSDRPWLLPHEMNPIKEKQGFALGLHVPGTYNKVIDVEACLLQQETGNQILREVKAYVSTTSIPVYGLKRHTGFWRFLMLRYSLAFDEWMVNVITSEERPEVILDLSESLSRKMDRIKTVVNNINPREASTAIGEHEQILSGEGYLTDRIGAFTFQISSNSFFQTNTLAALNLYQKVAEYAELTGTETVVDLYSGTGTIPVFLANQALTVTGIELNPQAVRDARRNCQKNGIQNCRFICGDMREKLTAMEQRPDVLIIDPPRAGMHRDVLAKVLSLSPQRIVYVSCNPATMARDLAAMIQSYEPVEAQPVDMFPHTYHIETVVKLELRKPSYP